VIAFAALDMAWEAWRRRGPPELAERTSNFVAFGIGEALRLATLPVRYAVFVYFSQRAAWHLPVTWLTAGVAYLAVDLFLYGLHRAMHQTRIGWAFHSTHHTSQRFDASLGGRVNWLQRIFDDLFYVPLVLAGLSPALVLFALEVNRFSQYWTHTEMIGRLGPVDWLFNTPSNHRVHHHCTPQGRRFNYGSNLVLWDHLFGTYRAEGPPHTYGTDLGPVGANPWTVQWAGLRDWVRTTPWSQILRLAYSAWFLVWAAAYAAYYGPPVFLWICCLANVAVLVGLWGERPALFSAAAAAVLAVQAVYAVDFLARLMFGRAPLGITDYLFDAGTPLFIRFLSGFHLWMPWFLLALVRHHGYERRVLGPLVLFTALVFLCSGLIAPADAAVDRALNINGCAGGPGVALWAWARYAAALVLPAHLGLVALFGAPRAVLSRAA